MIRSITSLFDTGVGGTVAGFGAGGVFGGITGLGGVVWLLLSDVVDGCVAVSSFELLDDCIFIFLSIAIRAIVLETIPSVE